MHKKCGFTLIELLTVVLILGILTSIALPQYRKAIQRAEAADALINLKTMFDAGKRYYSYHSSWPTQLKGLDIEFLDASNAGEVGEFQYSFTHTQDSCAGNGVCYASACRLIDNSAASSYCLTAYYRKNNVRDVYTCKDNSGGKYEALCDSMCPADYTSGTECVIE